MTRIQALRQLLFSNKAACRVLDRDHPDDDELKDALNDGPRLAQVLRRATRLTAAEVSRLAANMATKAGWTGANINDCDTVRMIARVLEMTNNTSFFNMVNANPALSDRWVKVAGEVVTAAREMFGVHLDHEDVASLVAARAATLGAHELDDYMAELSALQKVKDRLPTKATTKREPAPKADPGVPQHAMGAGDDAYARAEERAAMRRFADIRAGRLPSAEEAAQTDPAKLSDVEKIRYLMTVQDRSRRIALSREWNLTGL